MALSLERQMGRIATALEELVLTYQDALAAAAKKESAAAEAKGRSAAVEEAAAKAAWRYPAGHGQ